jgi:LPXTG-motif cell wall-anchored protein
VNRTGSTDSTAMDRQNTTPPGTGTDTTPATPGTIDRGVATNPEEVKPAVAAQTPSTDAAQPSATPERNEAASSSTSTPTVDPDLPSATQSTPAATASQPSPSTTSEADRVDSQSAAADSPSAATGSQAAGQEMPATSVHWLSMILGGSLLGGAGLILRRRK